VSFGLLIATGIGWLLLDSFVRVTGEFGPEHHPAERWFLVAHGIVAYAFLIVAGAMIPVHVTLGWNIGRNFKSGLMLAGTCVALAVTALGLYYLGDEIARHWVSVVHWSVGLLAGPALLIHALRGRRG
jgi:hypothetical protein